MYMCICISSCFASEGVPLIPAPAKKHSSGDEGPREGRLSEHQIRGWRAVSVAG